MGQTVSPSTSRCMAWRGSRARGMSRAPACIAFSRERRRLRSPVAPVRRPCPDADLADRIRREIEASDFAAKAIAKWGRDCALPGFARALAACAR